MDERVTRFKKARATLGVPQRTCAKILGVSQKQISDYEKGVTIPPEQFVQALESRCNEKTAALAAVGGGGGEIRKEDLEFLLSIIDGAGGAVSLGVAIDLLIRRSKI